MKISIITPVYNEEKNIKRYFNSLNKIEYPLEDFEVVIMNDGSTDKSLEILKEEKTKSKLNIRIINLEKNSGRALARKHGANASKYENLLFIDCKCEILSDALTQTKKLNYQAINGNPLQKNNHIFDTFFYLVRRQLRSNSFGENFKDIFITKKNFDSIGKGTTIFFCNKSLFLNSQLKNIQSKDNSDDTKLLWNIVQKKEILKTSKIKVYYNTRPEFFNNVKHIFHRGPKFVDYYYTPSKIHFWLINIAIITVFTIIYLIFKRLFLLELLITILALNTIVSLYLSQKPKDFLTVFFLLPIIGFTFFIGIIKGLFIKLFRLN